MPITLGILAQARQAPVAAGSYDLLETFSVGTAVASVEFTNLNATYGTTYRHLQLRITARQTGAFSVLGTSLRLGAPTVDTGSNYATHVLSGNGSSVSSSGSGSVTVIDTGVSPAASASANIFNGQVIDLLDAFSTTKNTTIRSFTGSATAVGLWSGVWLNTAAIQTIFIRPATNYDVGTRVSLYGIKG